MKKRIGTVACALLLLLTLISLPALASAPKVRLTGPAKERAQIVGERFTIGVAASGFDAGWVEVVSPSQTWMASLSKSATNYIPYTPMEAGEHTVTAVVMRKGSTRMWRSSITITVFPIDAQERAQWMVKMALACVGSTDAEKFVQYADMDATDDWCAAFIGWCARSVHISDAAGLQALFAGVDVYSPAETIACKTCRGNHLARFSATVLAAGKTPLPGDLVFFLWGSKQKSQRIAHPGYEGQWHGNASHVGLVTAVNGQVFSFVHGNVRMKHNLFGVVLNQSTDQREGKTYADWVIAFARPHYDIR